MLPCLSPEQLTDLLEGEIAPSDFEERESHLAECEQCRAEFLQRSEISDAEAWQNAARELLTLDEADRAVLDDFKSIASKDRNGDAGGDDLLDILFDKAFNSKAKQASPVASPNRKLPDVPGFEILRSEE